VRAIGFLAAVAVAAVAGCDGDDGSRARRSPVPPTAAEHAPRERPPPALRRAACRPEVPNCRAAAGRIAYLERVDPDGDGDAHFVLVSSDGVTAPGITVVDVRPDLRPRPLPRPGDRLSAAGPVFTGSYGQRQIEATEVFVQRR